MISFPNANDANISGDQVAMRMIEDVLQSVDDPTLIQPTSNNIFHMKDESMWYPHKYSAYDMECKNIKDVIECINQYICLGKSTAVFEATKFIMFNKLVCLVYVLNKFDIPEVQDWEHLVATAIINNNDVKFIMTILDYYAAKNPDTPCFSVDPTDNELLWLCIRVGNLEAFYVCLRYAYVRSEKWNDELSYKKYKDDPEAFVKKVAPTDEMLLSIANPRNLVYALFEDDVDVAMYLIEEGIDVDVWNNFPMKLIITKASLKQEKQLCRLMFDAGAKIPQYMYSIHKRVQQQARHLSDYIVKTFQAQQAQQSQQSQKASHEIIINGNSEHVVTAALEQRIVNVNNNVNSDVNSDTLVSPTKAPLYTPKISKEFLSMDSSDWSDSL
jgi:hypothetical protein